MTHPEPVVTDSGVPEVEQEPRHDHIFGIRCHTACPRWLNPVPQPGWETPQDWFFTFGADHTHPDTGNTLRKSFVRIHGTADSTRVEMLAAFGNRWAFQYPTAEKPIKIDRYDMVEVPMPGGGFEQGLARHAARLEADRVANLPVTPAEERTGVSDLRAAVLNDVVWLRENFAGRGFTERLDRIEQLARGGQR